MKKLYWWLMACAGLFAFGTTGIWFFAADKTIEPKPTGTVSTAVTAATEGQRTSPVLGKTIPGLPEYCADKLISVSGCEGMTEITTDQGNTYRLVEIGDQCWFADNLKEIPSTDQGWYGFYDDANEETISGEGMLYTWDAAMNGETEERAQGICPVGWHIPSGCEISRSLFPMRTSYEAPTPIEPVKIERHPLSKSLIIGKRGYPWKGITGSSFSQKENGSVSFFITGPNDRHLAKAAISEARGNYSCIKD